MALNRSQKQAVAAALISMAGNLMEDDWTTGYWDDIKDLNPEDVAQQLADWLGKLPGDAWDRRLPMPKSHEIL